MKTRYLNALFFTLIFCISCSTKQSLDTNSFSQEVFSLEDSYCEETRLIQVHLPNDYDESKKYPVIYVLDAQYRLFKNYIVSTIDYLSGDEIPESIVVAIETNDRSSGLIGGGRELFREFLSKKLIPHINSGYNTLNFNVLIGHSNSASFVLYTLFNDLGSDDFDGFIAFSPSIFPEEINLKSKKTNYLYFSYGSLGQSERLGENNAIGFTEKLKAGEQSHLKYKAEQFGNASHNNIVSFSLLNSFLHVFDLWNFLSLEYRFLNDSTFHLLNELELKDKRLSKVLNKKTTLSSNVYNYVANLYLSKNRISEAKNIIVRGLKKIDDDDEFKLYYTLTKILIIENKIDSALLTIDKSSASLDEDHIEFSYMKPMIEFYRVFLNILKEKEEGKSIEKKVTILKEEISNSKLPNKGSFYEKEFSIYFK